MSALLWAVHNCVAHPLLTLSFSARWATRFHDWTADKAIALDDHGDG